MPAHSLDYANIAELYISGPIGKQSDTCVIGKAFLHKTMTEKDKKSVKLALGKLPNGKSIEYGEWE